MKLPVLIHLPHASLKIPADVRGQFLLASEDLDRELLAHTDRFTDELFELAEAERLVFPVSRLVVDPERFRDDADEVMAARGLGAVYEKTHDGRPLKRTDNREELLRLYYDPHHAALEKWVSDALAESESCLIIDAHSFPSRPMPCDLDQLPDRPEICLGTDPIHTPSELVFRTQTAFVAAGWSVEIDRPYRGTITPASRYQKDNRVQSIMVEINRRLYMNEATGKKTADFDGVAHWIQSALREALSD